MHMTTFSGRITTPAAAVQSSIRTPRARPLDDRWRGVTDRHEFRLPSAQSHQARRRGGAFKRRLFGQIVAAAVRATEGTGYTGDGRFALASMTAHHTHLMPAPSLRPKRGRCGRAARPYQAQRYSGTADWEQIARLKQHVRTIRCSATARHLRCRRRIGHDVHHRL